jgi:hypothetical protein
MYTALFRILPEDCTDENKVIKVQRKTLLKIASPLSWYAQVLGAGKNFVHSLYKNAGWGWDYAWVELNNLTKRDIQWWRMIVLMSLKDPFVFAAKISHMRVIKSADISLYTDASTSVGGGAWLSSTDDQVLQEGFFRWSPEEIASIKRSGLDSKNFLMNEGTKVGINVLEFFAVFHFVIVWRQSLRGKVVKCNCDNSVAVAWLSTMRASNKSPVAESLMKIFSLFCIINNIQFISCYFPGILNTYADNLSRDVLLQETWVIAEDSKDNPWWEGLSPEVISRNFLRMCIIEPFNPRLKDLLRLLQALQ